MLNSSARTEILLNALDTRAPMKHCIEDHVNVLFQQFVCFVSFQEDQPAGEFPVLSSIV